MTLKTGCINTVSMRMQCKKETTQNGLTTKEN